MIPHTFVLEPGLKIYKIYSGYWGRPSTAELHQDLREITQRLRPDYKIDTPEMREKWEDRERKDFYPYGKSWKQVFAQITRAADRFERLGRNPRGSPTKAGKEVELQERHRGSTPRASPALLCSLPEYTGVGHHRETTLRR